MDSICDIDSLVTTYNTILADLINKHASEQKKSITARRKHQGSTREIRAEQRKRRRLETRWRRVNLAIDRVNFVKQKEKLKKILEDADTEYFQPL